METIDIIECKGTDPRTSTLVLKPGGDAEVVGNLPHGYTWRPKTKDDAERLAAHLLKGTW